VKRQKNKLLFPSPKNYFLNMENILDIKNLNIIKKCYKLVNNSHIKEKTPNYQENQNIKILNTFSF
jgi:hypothetical protein